MLNALAPYKPWKTFLTAVSLSVGILPAVAFPAMADHGVIIQRSRPLRQAPAPAVGNMIYGSPIPAPMPVNPTTGHSIRRSSRYDDSYYQPRRRDRTIERSTLINPTIVDSDISDSVLINPTIIRDRHSHRRYDYHQRRIYSPSRGVQIRIGY